MQYLARKLHLPSGEPLERCVVQVDDGKVVRWYPFVSESQSMLLVDELFLRDGDDGLLTVGEMCF